MNVAATTDMLSIQLSQKHGAASYKVNSVDIEQPNFKHRLAFSKDNSIEKIFAPELAAYVRRLLENVNRNTMVVSQPDAVVDLPNLVLGRLRMLVHTAENLMRQVIVRFTYFIGGVQSAFAFDTSFALPSVTHREALAVSALQDICEPVFEVVNQAVTTLMEDPAPFLHANQASADTEELENDLLFYLELLKRYIVSANNPELLDRQNAVLGLIEPR